MKIAIDCRYLNMSGIGRFIEGIITSLDDENEYTFIGNSNQLSALNLKGKFIEDNTSPFSLKGLLKTHKEINECDCFFAPNFIIPFNIKIPIYTTIHDTIFFDLPQTNKSFFDKLIKKYFYKRCVKLSRKIFTVSNFTKKRIINIFKVKDDKVIVVYNGIYKKLMEYASKQKLPVEKENYIVFIGNFKVQKNLSVLIKAMNILKDKTSMKLKIIGSKDNLRNYDESIKIENLENVEFMGHLQDNEMYEVISKSKFLIQPSIYEGFGMPPLEAMYLGTKCIISDIEVFREIYNDHDVIFFNPFDASELADKIINSDYHLKNKNDDFYNFNNVKNKILDEVNQYE